MGLSNEIKVSTVEERKIPLWIYLAVAGVGLIVIAYVRK